MKVVAVQMEIAWEDRASNYARVRKLLGGVDSGSLVVLPEMFSTGFSMRVDRTAEEEKGPTATFLSELASSFGVTVVAGGVQAGNNGQGRNTAWVFGPEGQELARYVKVHPFSYAGETEHYESGEGPMVFSWGGFTVCPAICYDLRFPELFREATLELGADLLVVVANWPAPRAAHWRALALARAIENQAYLVAVNRAGADPSNAYAGGSLIVDPRGRILAEADADESVLEADLQLRDVTDYRTEFPALSDARFGR